MTDVGYSWFIGKLTEDPRTTETITITYPNYSRKYCYGS